MRSGKILTSLLVYLFWSPIIKRKKYIVRIFALLLLMMMAEFAVSCYYYKVTATYAPGPDELNQFSNLGKNFIVHQDYSAYYITDLSISGDTLLMKIGDSYYKAGEDFKPVSPNSVKRYRPKKGDARLLNEVHLYVNDQVVKDNATWTVPIVDLERLDVYNHSTNHTVAYSILFGVAMIPAAYVAVTLLFFLIMALSGNSCPFIYTYNGEEYVFAGEIYSGAVYPPLERDDYLLLSDLVADGQQYSIKISNQLEEVQHTNLLELLVYDHPEGTEVLVDKFGIPHGITSEVSPATASTLEGLDVLALMEKEDDLIYVGKDPSHDPPLLDGIILTFNKPEKTSRMNLIVEAKNSYWLDFVYQNFREMLGVSYDMWMKKQKDGDPQKMEDWTLSQHIPLAVYLWKDGDWRFQDYYHTVGPMAFKKDILPLDLTGVEEGPIRIKLEAGSYFWEIGYVAMGVEEQEVGPGTMVSITRAIDESGEEVKQLLMEDDDQYYIQPEIGNEATVSFEVPPEQGLHRTIVLHSKGYYQIIQDPKGLPRIRDLNEIRKTGNFNRYSNDLMKAMLEEYVFVDGKEKK